MVGGGDSAAGFNQIRFHLLFSFIEESIFLTKYASKVYVLVRRDKLRASKVMADRLMNHPKIEILWNTLPVEAKGDGDSLNALEIKNVITNETKDLKVFQ